MTGTVLDSNILIYLLNGKIAPKDLLAYGTLFISTATIMELYALAGMSSKEEQLIEELLGQLSLVPIDANIAKRAGVLARTHHRSKPDLIIAATALLLGLPLVTNNARDFKNIRELEVIPLK